MKCTVECEYKSACTYDAPSLCPKWRGVMVEVVCILIAFYMIGKKGER